MGRGDVRASFRRRACSPVFALGRSLLPALSRRGPRARALTARRRVAWPLALCGSAGSGVRQGRRGKTDRRCDRRARRSPRPHHGGCGLASLRDAMDKPRVPEPDELPSPRSGLRAFRISIVGRGASALCDVAVNSPDTCRPLPHPLCSRFRDHRHWRSVVPPALLKRLRDHDRAPLRFRGLPRLRRRPVRGAYRNRLAAAHRLAHEPPQLMLGGATKRAEFIASRWADARNVTRRSSVPTRADMARRRPSSATISSWRPCRSASSSSPAPASPTTSPTRRGNSGSRCGGSEARLSAVPKGARADPDIAIPAWS